MCLSVPTLMNDVSQLSKEFNVIADVLDNVGNVDIVKVVPEQN